MWPSSTSGPSPSRTRWTTSTSSRCSSRRACRRWPVDRRAKTDWPLLIAGGPGITMNPEPLAPFFDAMVIGEAEEIAGPRSLDVAALRATKSQRARCWTRWIACPASTCRLACRAQAGRTPRIERLWVADVERLEPVSQSHTPDTEFGAHAPDRDRAAAAGAAVSAWPGRSIGRPASSRSNVSWTGRARPWPPRPYPAPGRVAQRRGGRGYAPGRRRSERGDAGRVGHRSGVCGRVRSQSNRRTGERAAGHGRAHQRQLDAHRPDQRAAGAGDGRERHPDADDCPGGRQPSVCARSSTRRQSEDRPAGGGRAGAKPGFPAAQALLHGRPSHRDGRGYPGHRRLDA